MKHAQEYLITKGIKPSIQRIAIMKFLLEHHTHPTVDEIFESLNPTMPTLSKTTIYNNLVLFSDRHAISIITIDPKNARFDATTAIHGHFLCNGCGMVFDIPITEDVHLDSQEASHFEITDTQVYLHGYCEKCRKEMEAEMVDDKKTAIA